MKRGPFIAIDWGTSNRRIHLVERGVVIASESSGHGIASFAGGDYTAEVAALRQRLGEVPVLIAGMAGSSIGWRETPYVDAPAGLAALAARLVYVQTDTAIVPGMRTTGDGRADVMRGEEVQILGAVAAGLVPPDATVCQPGTHSKWARLEGGSILSFATVMTGELFALVRGHGILANHLGGETISGPAFAQGVAEGSRRDLANSLFQVRARSLGGLLDPADAVSFASGILIGAECAVHVVAGATVYLIASEPLDTLYAAAIEALGGTAIRVDDSGAFVAGMAAIRDLAS